ncbi:hypothetical protein AVEN_23627-1 [Araneus ventricosus]|uniref:Uncharacterized protein n=1 Tax=Araneus ventricosus TaxID=182803 RepID=A0A4Y2BJN5_ARAVE|nr:hypothetical protein AVEN_23627-1 [Araneus ventricosus]
MPCQSTTRRKPTNALSTNTLSISAGIWETRRMMPAFNSASLVTCPRYTRSLRKPHSQKFQGFRSGDLDRQAFGLFPVSRTFNCV